MKNTMISILALCWVIVPALAQDGTPTRARPHAEVPLGQKMKVEGVIVERGGDRFVVRDHSNREMMVRIGSATEIKEKKANFLRAGEIFSTDDLIPGLNVEVKGVGDVDGNLIANEVRFTQDDLKVAQTIWSRVDPVENRLTDAEQDIVATRDELRTNKAETEGRLEELDAAFQLSRDEARGAREAADAAQSTADAAIDGVINTNERIAMLDDYVEKNTVVVLFDLNSSELSRQAREELDEFVARSGDQKAYLLEVTGYASADGNADYNRLLSEQRAEQVIRYLVDEHQVPIRRILQAFGHGENLPATDNKTFEGRRQNRRVQVRFLVSRAMVADPVGN